MEPTGINGRIALVTGAAQGIGAAVTRSLRDGGATVAGLDVRSGEDATHVVDVADPEAVEETVARVERDLGPVDVLVNVAGVLRPGKVAELGDDDWRSTFAVNTDGVFHMCRAVSQRMIPRKRGSIVTVGSNAAGVPRYGMASYAASKAAATLFTKSLGLELAEHGIRCNVVSPGPTDTEMQRDLWADDDGAEAVIAGSLETYKAGIPLNRLATADDIADAVMFLVSDRAKHVTMHDLYVDGGTTLRA